MQADQVVEEELDHADLDDDVCLFTFSFTFRKN